MDPKTFNGQPFRINTRFEAKEYEKLNDNKLMSKKARIKLRNRIDDYDNSVERKK
jgi:hypothetical protein